MTLATVSARPIWLRLLQAPLTRLVALGGVLISLMAVAEGFNTQFKSRPGLATAITVGMGGLALALYVAWAKLVERRGPAELSLAGAGREWATGALIGAGLYATCVLILMVLGFYRIDGLNAWTFLIPVIPMALKSGLFEELVFRGVLFRSVETMAGSWVAIVVSSLVFGFLHLMNANGTLAGAVAITIEAGLLLAAAYLVTRRLWLAIGYHMSWNYTQSAIFSGVVSGDVKDPGLLRTTIQGPELLTGGAFGMESSLIAVAVCTLNGLILLAVAVRRGHIEPPPWAGRRS